MEISNLRARISNFSSYLSLDYMVCERDSYRHKPAFNAQIWVSWQITSSNRIMASWQHVHTIHKIPNSSIQIAIGTPRRTHSAFVISNIMSETLSHFIFRKLLQCQRSKDSHLIPSDLAVNVFNLPVSALCFAMFKRFWMFIEKM